MDQINHEHKNGIKKEEHNNEGKLHPGFDKICGFRGSKLSGG